MFSEGGEAGRGVLVASTFGDGETGGGLVSIDGSQTAWIDRVSTMGMALDDGRLARVLRCAPQDALLNEVVVYDDRGVAAYLRLDDVAATHDVAWDGNTIAVVSPWHNVVRWYALDGTPAREVRYPGPTDAWHLNCLARREGLWYATLFGDFATARGWDVADRGATGQLVELATARTVLEGLHSPHSPRWVDDAWVLCNSGTSELVACDDRSGRIVRRADCGGWTRGLAYDDDHFYVGASARRTSAMQPVINAHIAVVDRRTWTTLERIPLPARAVYELLFIPEALLDAVRRGFGVLGELGAVRAFEPVVTGEPLPWSEFRARVACEPPAECIAGAMLELAISVTNLGSSAFTSAPPVPVYASYKWLDPEAGAYLSPARAHRSKLPRTLYSGETLEMRVLVVVPDRAGPAVLRVTLMQEGVAWFDDQDPESGVTFALEIAPRGVAARPVVPAVR